MENTPNNHNNLAKRLSNSTSLLTAMKEYLASLVGIQKGNPHICKALQDTNKKTHEILSEIKK